MIIVMAIIGIITVVVITSQGTFNKSLVLSNAAYDLALTIRSTQSYGLGGRVSTGLISNTGYGLHFTAGGAVKSFTRFADSYPATAIATNCHGVPITGATSPDAKIGDCAYQPLRDSATTTITFNHGVTVSRICAINTAGTRYCSSGGDSPLSGLDISFVRPDPAPFFARGGVGYDPSIRRACVTLVSLQGGERTVSVNSTGEIDANAPSCP